MKPTFRRISRTFIKGAEFKTRQLWLDFCDVAGTVLEVLEPVKAAAWAWFEKWCKGFVRQDAEQEGPKTLALSLSRREYSVGHRTHF